MVLVFAVIMLVFSNLFMYYAWYGHLKTMEGKPLYLIILASWMMALFEYALLIPAIRWLSPQLDTGKIRILQEVIGLSVFVPFALFYLKEKLSWDYLWAACCLAGTVYFIFRGR